MQRSVSAVALRKNRLAQFSASAGASPAILPQFALLASVIFRRVLLLTRRRPARTEGPQKRHTSREKRLRAGAQAPEIQDVRAMASQMQRKRLEPFPPLRSCRKTEPVAFENHEPKTSKPGEHAARNSEPCNLAKPAKGMQRADPQNPKPCHPILQKSGTQSLKIVQL